MKSFRLIFILTFLSLVFGCMSENEKEMIKDCDGLAMKFYRGLPKPAKLYKEYCEAKVKTLEYSPEVCKRAMGDLMINGSRKRLMKMFGDRIMECFNEADLERFEKAPPPPSEN